MATPAETVAEQFSLSNSYASAAKAQADVWLAKLADSLYAPPSLSVTWHAPAAPPQIADPLRPTILNDLTDVELDQDVLDAKPEPLSILPPSVNISTDFEDAPVLGPAPELTFGAVPSVHTVEDIDVPDAPAVTLPGAPSMLTLSTPTFGGVDLHEDFLEKFQDVPDLALVAPTPYSHSPGPEYASELLTELQLILKARLSGGTGLDPTIEQAIWDRSRDRETNLAQGAIADVLRQSEALGFNLPAGVTAAALVQVRRDLHDKTSGLSRDIAIKQADLEQSNLRESISAGIQLEGMLVDQALRMETLAFENSKAYAENAIQIHNAQVEHFKALMQRSQTLATVYRTIIDAELSKVEVFKGLLQAEQTKADTNRALVEQYKAEIEGRMAVVRLYEAQLGGLNAKMQIERTRIEASAEAIKGFVAGVNAETTKLEAWKIEQTVNADLYRSKSQAFAARVSAQGDAARANLGAYQARWQAHSEEWRGYGIAVEAEKARIDAVAKKSEIALNVFRADCSLYESKTASAMKYWEVQIKQYEAQQNYTISSWKINTDTVMSMNQARLDAAKTGAQIYSQLSASALSRIGVSAQVQASGGTTVAYRYDNKTSGSPPAITAI